MLSSFMSSKMKHLFLYRKILRLDKFLFQVNMLKYWLYLLVTVALLLLGILIYLPFIIESWNMKLLLYWNSLTSISKSVKHGDLSVLTLQLLSAPHPHGPVFVFVFVFWSTLEKSTIIYQESCYFAKIHVYHESIYCYSIQFLDEWI